MNEGMNDKAKLSLITWSRTLREEENIEIYWLLWIIFVSQEYTCATVEDCTQNLSDEEIYKMLMLNFKRHYITNRAPLGLHFHAAWFENPANIYAFTVSSSSLHDNELSLQTSYQSNNMDIFLSYRNLSTICFDFRMYISLRVIKFSIGWENLHPSEISEHSSLGYAAGENSNLTKSLAIFQVPVNYRVEFSSRIDICKRVSNAPSNIRGLETNSERIRSRCERL